MIGAQRKSQGKLQEVIVSEMCLNEPYRFLKWAQEQFRRRIYLSKRVEAKMHGTCQEP